MLKYPQWACCKMNSNTPKTVCHPERLKKIADFRKESKDLRTNLPAKVSSVRRSFDSLRSLRMTNFGPVAKYDVLQQIRRLAKKSIPSPGGSDGYSRTRGFDKLKIPRFRRTGGFCHKFCSAQPGYRLSLIFWIISAYSSSLSFFRPGFMAKGVPHSYSSLYLGTRWKCRWQPPSP